MQKVAAVYCVYENSGFLAESVRRVYPLMDKIIFLLNFKPWNGQGDFSIVEKTYRDILEMYDPYHKFEIVSGYWESEAAQRNFGLKRCRELGIAWDFIIDDDEMYNYVDLKNQLESRILVDDCSVYLSPHQVYWKSPQICINHVVAALPSFASTDEGRLYFNEARAIVTSGSWHTFNPADLICHHYSYVRNDESMLRKIRTFSHADPSLEQWYKDTWLKWHPDMEDIHPNKDNPSSFKKAVSYTQSSYQLEPCEIFPDSQLERLLKASECLKFPFDTNWLKINSKTNHLIDPILGFVYCFAQRNPEASVLEIGTDTGLLYYAMCEAVLKSGTKINLSSFGERPLGAPNQTYQNFSKQVFSLGEQYNIVHIAKETSPDVLKLALSKLVDSGYLMLSGTQTHLRKLFETERSGRPYYEFKQGEGFGIIQMQGR